MASRRARISLGLLGLLGVAALGVWQFGPTLLEDTVRERVLAELDERGIDASIGDLALSTRDATLRDVCVMHLPPHEAHEFVCFETIAVTFNRDGLLSTDVEPTSLSAHDGRIDLSSERGSLVELVARYREFATSLGGSDRADDGSGAATRPSDRVTPTLMPVHVENVAVDLSGQGLMLAGVDVRSVDLGGEREDVDITLALRDPGVPRFLRASLPETWRVRVTPHDELPAIDIEPSTPVSVALPGPLAGARLAVGGVAFQPPYTFEARNVALTDERERIDASFEHAALELRELTTSLPELYFTSLTVDGLRADLAVDGELRPTILGASPDPADDAEGASDDADAEPTDAEPTDAGPWDERVWWEKIPQRIDVRGADLSVHRASNPDARIAVSELDASYALRIFHFQLDVTVDAKLLGRDEPLGRAHVELRWNWDRGRMRLDTALQVDDLPELERFVRGDEPWMSSGAMHLNARVREADSGPGLWFSGDTAVTDLEVTLPVSADGDSVLPGPLRIGRFAWSWVAERSDDDNGVRALRFSRGDGELEGARFVFLPQLDNFRWDRSPILTGGRLRTEIPVQPIAILWDAIPDAVLGPLADAEMSGEWGLENEFAFSFEPDEDDPDGRRRLRIEAPDVHIVHDEHLELISLPEALDVRRMLDAFSFVWEGPEGTDPRPFDVPPPVPPRAPGADPEPGETGFLDGAPERREQAPGGLHDLDDPRWARMREISPWLETVHLYREDGSFFRNRGFNWYQVRRVVEEMWWERRAGRGASTVSMQLVKNVFLSHERTLPRKLQEMFLTYWMTRLVDKDRILEIYFNIIEWGPGVHGVIEAADYYFGALPGELSLAEAAWLSAIVPAPVTRSRQRDAGEPPAYMQRRIHDIIDGLRGRDLISDAEQLKGHAQQVLFVTHAGWAEAWPERALRRFGTALEPSAGAERTTAAGP